MNNQIPRKIISRCLYLCFTFFLILGCAGTRDSKKADWVSQNLFRMTIEEKIGQMMVVRMIPQYYHSDNPTFLRYLNLIQEYHIGGIAISAGNPYAVVRDINRLQKVAKISLLVMADNEWGITQRVGEGTTFLQNMAIGATGSAEYAYQMGVITARECRAIGIHVGFAPVMDVNNNPDNVIINTRSYGEDPELVARLGSAFIRGLQENGVYATAKHFPGHGDTEVDTHLGLPTVNASQERMSKVELVPFKAALDAGVKLVMVAHITYSGYPQMQGRPATLDPYFIRDVLRKQMDFQGLVISDAMEMGGIVNHYWSGEAAVMAINAGVDLILYSPNFETTFDFVVKAVKEGRIPIERINEAVRRILQAKRAIGLNEKPDIDLNYLETVMGSPENFQKAEEIANSAMTLLRDDKGILPLSAEKIDSMLVVSITDREWGYIYKNNLNQEVQNRIPMVRSALIDPRSTQSEIQEIISKTDSAQAIIIGLFVKWGDSKGSVTLPDTTVQLVKNLFKIEKPMVVVAFGSPYLLRQIPEAPSYICAYETNTLAIRAAIRAVFGEISLKAKSPVSLPGLYDIGDGIAKPASKMELVTDIRDDLLNESYTVLQKAIEDSIFPGAQIAIVHAGKLIANRGFGRQTYHIKSPLVNTETIYDLGSVTKVVATTMVAMELYERNQIRLDIPVKSYLPKFKGEFKDSVTVKHLLTHSGGLHWWSELWKYAKNKQEALDYIYNLPLDYVPGDSMIYSDLGIILLGEIIETVTGKKIDQLANEMIYQPMGMQNTMYNPPGELLSRIAPTEISDNMDRGLIHGKVHDENTYFFGGISTQAGVFSTAEDLAALAQMLLNGGIYRHKRFYSPQTIKEWTSRQEVPPGSGRALGWDTPADEGSSAGDYFSQGSFGHLGFTGTSIWIDPHREIAIILLTNRVHPTRHRNGMFQVRRDFHNAAMKALLEQLGEKRSEKIPEEQQKQMK
jgi:beta-N-acetylhexosaminidase